MFKPNCLDRREFLRRGALAAGGILGLRGGGRAIAEPLPRGPVVSSVELHSKLVIASGSYCENHPMLAGYHVYRYDCHFEAGQPLVLPAGFVRTFRLEFCTGLTELVPILSPPADSDGFPSLPSGDSALQTINYVRIVEPLDGQTLRVYEGCSFYCTDGLIRVLIGGPSHQLLYATSATGAATGTGTATPVHVEDSHPVIHFSTYVAFGQAVGGGYYATDNQEQGYSDETVWTQNLSLDTRTQLRVSAFLPGSSQPETRTRHAVYEITHADGAAVVEVSQQRAASGYVSLGVYAFTAGSASVRLTNETGEPAGTTEVVANAMLWTNA
jgi:hypothetical protein